MKNQINLKNREKDNILKVGMLKIKDLSVKLTKLLEIERIGDEPKLWLEEIGEKTKLGVFWSSFIIVFLYFFLLDMLSLVLTIGRPIDIYPRIKNYMFFTLSWQVVVWFALYLLFYFKNIYLETINNLYSEKKLNRQDYDSLRKRLLLPKYRFYILGILIILLTIAFINSIINYFAKPDILWGLISLDELGLKNSNLALTYTVLRWAGNLIQIIVLADLFTILFSFLTLGKNLPKILKFDLLNSDRRGGYRVIGKLYFKIMMSYLLALLLFIVVTRDYPINHPYIMGKATYYFIALVGLLFGFSLFIYPLYSIHLKLNEQKDQCIKNIMDKLKNQNVLNKDSSSIYSLQLMLFLNEIDKMKTYFFSGGQFIEISTTILINVVVYLFKESFSPLLFNIIQRIFQI